jgi:crotonobetainyl-CoA:carnitine CoA-transferase CaiB-like acyl-CoA transferase
VHLLRQLLSGTSVVELDGGIAGTYCAKLFADLGADVVKVESGPGDLLRARVPGAAGTGESGRGGAFVHLNTNKRSVAADQSDPASVARVQRLVERAHLVVETAGQGLTRWGLTAEELRQRQPGLSVVTISGFGSTGPYADFAWDDIVVQAAAGTLLLQGRADQDPLRLPGYLGLCFVGSMAALGGLAAVIGAASSGEGSVVDCAAVEALATLPARQGPLLAYEYRGREDTENGLIASSDTLIPTGVYPCADGYMAMMSTPQQLNEMLEVLDSDDLKAAFARPDAFERGETKEAVDAALYPWLFSHTRAEATAAAQRVGWPLAGINSVQEALAASHLHQRGFWVHSDDPAAGPVDLPGPPHRFAEGGWALRRLAPALGEHTDAVMAGDDPAADDPAADDPAADGAPVTVTGSGRVPKGAAGTPLAGIRVLDMTAVWAGPYATMLLADLGAEVIRVENPWVLPPTTKGYTARPVFTNLGFLGSLYGPPVPDRPDRPFNRHALNNSLARNKLSCTIDTRRAEGRELVMRLAEQCDVFIDNFKANGLARMGIEVSELQARNPRLVIVRMPPAGTTGDWSGYTGFGAQFDGLTGMMSLCGHRGSDLTTSPATTYMDGASGPAAAFATIAALRYRAATGRGQVVEFAQSENVLNHLGDVFVDCQLGVEPERFGNRDRWRAPQGMYRCRGEHCWLALSVGDDEQWRALATALGRPELGEDARFADVARRQANHDELDELIGAWTAERELPEAFRTLQAAGVPAGPLLDDKGFTTDEHLLAREWLQPLHSLDLGEHLHAGFAYRGVPQVAWRGSPVLGEDNDYVYRDILGVGEEEFAHYRDEKILADDYLDPLGEPY